MKNTIQIIAAIVVIAALSYVTYLTYQDNIRKKELDKKMSDNLDKNKEINDLIIQKLKSGEINLFMQDTSKKVFSHNSPTGKKRAKK